MKDKEIEESLSSEPIDELNRRMDYNKEDLVDLDEL